MNTDYLSGSYLLTFKQVAVEPDTMPLVDAPQFTLWGTEDGFIATTRVRHARVQNCKLSFPYLPSRPGKPQDDAPVKTFFCPFADIRPKREYATIKKQVFLTGSQTSMPVNKACRRIATFIQKGRDLVVDADNAGFWQSYFEYVHRAVRGAGCYEGSFFVLRKDGRKYKYLKLCSEKEFRQLYALAAVHSEYAYFCDICAQKPQNL